MHWLDRAELNADLTDLDAGLSVDDVMRRSRERRALDDYDQGPDYFTDTR